MLNAIIYDSAKNDIPYLWELCSHALSNLAAAPRPAVGPESAASVGWLRTPLHITYSCECGLNIDFTYPPESVSGETTETSCL